MTDERHSLLGPYLLDALEPAERAEFEQHLGACPDCRADAAELRVAVAALAEDAARGPSRPPARLGEQLLAQVRQTPQLAPTRSRRRRLAALAAAAAAAVVVAGGVLGVRALSEDDPAPTTAEAVMTAPDVRSHEMSTTEGMVRVSMSHEMHMVAVDTTGLADPGDGMAYQLWWVDDASADPVAMLSEGERVATEMTSEHHDADLVLTMEPDSGSQRPSTAPLIAIPAAEL